MPDPAESSPIAGLGYHKVFEDDFSTLDYSVWRDRSAFNNIAAPLGSQYVANGTLHLVSKRSNGYPRIQVNTYPCGWEHGYFEARLRFTSGNGSWPAFWLFSLSHASGVRCPPLVGEINVELHGSRPRTHWGVLHRDTSNTCGREALNANRVTADAGEDLSAAFHRYGILWSASEVCWFLDDAKLKCSPSYDSTNQPMYLILDMFTGAPFPGTSPVDSSTPNELHTEVDYVEGWQL